MSEPWGHKVAISIYVSGDMEHAVRAAECAADQLLILDAAFVGIAIEEVKDEPYDQGAS